MKKPFALLALICFAALAFQSCGESSKPSNTDTAVKPDSLSAVYQLSIETHKAEEAGCKSEDCTHILLRVPVLKGGDRSVAANPNRDDLSRSGENYSNP